MHNAAFTHIKLLASYNSSHVISPEYVKSNQEVTFVPLQVNSPPHDGQECRPHIVQENWCPGA